MYVAGEVHGTAAPASSLQVVVVAFCDVHTIAAVVADVGEAGAEVIETAAAFTGGAETVQVTSFDVPVPPMFVARTWK